uniref:Zinc finger and BTB domain containing 38 n=1 Tax=Scophthalmus maximus TaxID=52904 RepID=A0A8D3BEE0_SCOMX
PKKMQLSLEIIMTVVCPCTQNLMDSAHPHTVLSKLNEQRSQGLFCDVTIVVEDVKFRAHKNILAACSGYFRNALTASETWSSSQVLELMDLKSEVFASILNFIYSSKVTSPGSEDTRGLVAAGKRLGIPFLEKLAEQERQDESSIGPVCKTTKKEAPKPEEIDSARGPRITNAFSITEVCPGINPFTPLVQTSGERRSPDVAQPPSSCPTTSCLNGNNETAHALSEHSYAVSKSSEGIDSSQSENKKVSKPAISQQKQLFYKNVGPLKKRHRLTGIVGRTILPTPAEPQTDTPYTVTATLADGVTAEPAAVMTPPALVSAEEREESVDPMLPKATENVPMELGPPTLSPHTEDSISIYGCEHCSEIFMNKALLKRHENVHSWQRAYPCHYCNKVFALAEYRTKHEIWHTGERRYQCIFCLETFMTYYILKNHQKSFHGIDPSLAVKKKSANGGLKASVYPIKLYRLLPMNLVRRPT